VHDPRHARTPRITPPLKDTAMMLVPILTSPGFKPGVERGVEVDAGALLRIEADKYDI